MSKEVLKKTNQFFVISPYILFERKVTELIGIDGAYYFMYLLRRAGQNNNAFPSYKRIQEDLCISRQKISKLNSVLVKYNFIHIKRTKSVNYYYLNINDLMQKNIMFYSNKNKDIELPDINIDLKDTGFQNHTLVVPKSYSGSSKMEPEVDTYKNKNNKEIITPEMNDLIDGVWSHLKELELLPSGKAARDKLFHVQRQCAKNLLSDFSYDRIAEVLNWAIHDDFWKYNLDLKSFHKIKAQYDRSRTVKKAG